MPSKPLPNQNHLLGALSPAAQDRLFHRLELVTMPRRGVLSSPGQSTYHVYFPTNAIISLQYILQNGQSTALLVIGKEGLLGIDLSLGGVNAPSYTLVQSAGYAYRLPKTRVTEEFNRHGQFLELMLRYTQATITQISQTAVCNRHHAIDQQLCRWLLISLDRMSSNRLPMTQEFIASMLGVRREGVTQSANKLQQQGVIAYKRGLIQVIDRPKLESLSCECYQVVRDETKMLLDYTPQPQTVTSTSSIPTITLPISKNSGESRPLICGSK